MDNTDKLVKVLINSYFKEYNRIKKLYEKHKLGKLQGKKADELKEDISSMKRKINYLLGQMNEKIESTKEIQDYDKKIYEQYINLRNILMEMNDEIAAIEKGVNGGQNGEPSTQT
ncbi:MAG: hypothetical protein ACP5LI_07920 [Hydrogenobaculum sp.]